MSKAPPKARCAGCAKELENYTMQVAEKLFHNVDCYRLWLEAEAKGTKRFNAG